MTPEANRRYFALLGGGSPTKSTFTDEEVSRGFQQGLDLILSSPERTARIQQETSREERQFDKETWDKNFEKIISKQLAMQAESIRIDRWKAQIDENQVNVDILYKQALIEASQGSMDIDNTEINKQLKVAYDRYYEMVGDKEFKNEEEQARWMEKNKLAKDVWTTITYLEAAKVGLTVEDFKKTIGAESPYSPGWLNPLDLPGNIIGRKPEIEFTQNPAADPTGTQTKQMLAFLYDKFDVNSITALEEELAKPGNEKILKEYNKYKSRLSGQGTVTTTPEEEEKASKIEDAYDRGEL